MKTTKTKKVITEKELEKLLKKTLEDLYYWGKPEFTIRKYKPKILKLFWKRKLKNLTK